MIRKELITAATDAFCHVFKAVGTGQAEVLKIQSVTQISPFKELCVGIGFEGGAEGGVYLMVDHVTGAKIAARMEGAESVQSEEAVVCDLMELLNMVAGNSVGLFAKAGVRISITTPTAVSDPLTPPYGGECAVVFMQTPLGPVKAGLVVAEGAGG